MLNHIPSLENDVWQYTTMLRQLPVLLGWKQLISQTPQDLVQGLQADYNKSCQFPTVPDGLDLTRDLICIY